MKWEFADFGSKSQRLKRARIESQIKEFWLEFSTVSEKFEHQFRASDITNIINWLDSNLANLDEGLVWELTAISPDSLLLSISPENRLYLRPLAKCIIDFAPKLDGWKFVHSKSPNLLALHDLADSRIRGHWLTTEFSMSVNESINSVSVDFYSKTFNRENTESDLIEAYGALYALIGEEATENWLDSVNTVPYSMYLKSQHLNSSCAQALSGISELPGTFDIARQKIMACLPQLPYWQTNFDVYHSIERNYDLNKFVPERIIFNTGLPKVVDAVIQRTTFLSEAFSRFHEKFCYLKISGSHPVCLNPADTTEFQISLDQALRSAGVGCVSGRGHGLKSAFIDLVLVDVRKAIPFLKMHAEKFKLPPSSWLLFLDSDWSQESVGLFSGSPIIQTRDLHDW